MDILKKVDQSTNRIELTEELITEVIKLRNVNQKLHRKLQLAERFQHAFMSKRHSWINYLMGKSFAISKGFNSEVDAYIYDVDNDIAGGIIKSLSSKNEAMEKALEWYKDQASAAKRYVDNTNTDALMAIVTSLSLDGGNRADKALKLNAPDTYV